MISQNYSHKSMWPHVFWSHLIPHIDHIVCGTFPNETLPIKFSLLEGIHTQRNGRLQISFDENTRGRLSYNEFTITVASHATNRKPCVRLFPYGLVLVVQTIKYQVPVKPFPLCPSSIALSAKHYTEILCLKVKVSNITR